MTDRGRLFAAGAPEGRDAEIEEDDDHDRRGDEGAVVGAMGIAEAGAPERGREDDDGQKEEDAGDFEPEDAADAAKGLEESAETTGEAGAEVAGGASCAGRVG